MRPQLETNTDVIKRIVAQLEKGVMPWRKPWANTTEVVVIGSMPYSVNMWPSNLRAPAVPFGVHNGITLLTQAQTKKYRTNLWITDETRRELRAHLVNSDEPATNVAAYSSGTNMVYNIDQIKDCEKALGLSFAKQETPEGLRYKKFQGLLKKVEKFYDLEIVHRGNHAAYYPDHDKIMMPSPKQFKSIVGGANGEAHYWATLWHEIVHWTGHKSRLGRKFTGRFSDPDYAFEELIAELGSAFLCAHLQIDGELQHASYIQSWIRILESQEIKFEYACKYADMAKRFILNSGKPIREKMSDGTVLVHVPQAH